MVSHLQIPAPHGAGLCRKGLVIYNTEESGQFPAPYGADVCVKDQSCTTLKRGGYMLHHPPMGKVYLDISDTSLSCMVAIDIVNNQT